MVKKSAHIFFSLIGLCAFLFIFYLFSCFIYSQHLASYDHAELSQDATGDAGAPLNIATDVPGRVRILAINGGALKGLAELEVLRAIEERSGKRIHELFDFFAGASTGAIMSSMLLLPRKDTRQPATAEEVIELYEEFAGDVFDAPAYHAFLTGFGLFGPLFTNDGRIDVARRTFGDATFNTLLRPALFPAFAPKQGDVELFRNWKRGEHDVPLWRLLTAVTSIPATFPAIELDTTANGDQIFIDPGLLNNAPGDIGYLNARLEFPEAEEFIVVLLESNSAHPVEREIALKGGLLQWIRPAYHMVFEGQFNSSLSALTYHAKFRSNINLKVVVVDPATPSKSSQIDPSRENMDLLRQGGRDFVKANEDQLDQLIKLLTAP